MPVPSAITDLSTTAGSNSPAGTDSIGTNMDDYVRAHAAFLAQLRDGSKNLALGSAGAPSQAFTGDSNTGTFSPNADIWAVSTGGTERLRVDASGRIINTSATQPAFYVTGPITLGTPVIFSNYSFNHGSHFNMSTGVFTAPVTGKYFFTAGLGNTSLTTGVTFTGQLADSEGHTTLFSCYKHGTDAAGANVSVILYLTASSTVQVNCSTGPSTASSQWNFFSGYLLS